MDNSENAAASEPMNDVAHNFKNLQISEKSPIVTSKLRPSNSKRNHLSAPLLKELSDNRITPLKKNSLRFPHAKFYCNACEYHCDTVEVCKKHISESRHKKSVQILEQKTTILVLPKPNSAQENAITEVITEVARKNGMTPATKKKCHTLKDYIEKKIKAAIPDVSLLINGSVLSGFALESSGLDLELVISPEDTKEIGNIFEKVYKIVLNHKKFQNPTKAFAASYPQVCFKDGPSQINVSIGLRNTVSLYTNELLSHYAALDPRVKILGVAFRYWAKLCEVDKFAEGTLAPRCFPLMLIYFLQRCKEPVLPCLHQARNNVSYTKPDELEPRWESANVSSVGCLWLELLRFYAVGISFKHCLIDITSPHYLFRTTKRSVKMAIEEPLCHKNSTPGKKWMLSQYVTSNDVFYYIFATFRNSFFYFLVPQRSYGPLFYCIKNADLFCILGDIVGNNQNKDNSCVNDTTMDGETAEEGSEPEIKAACTSSNFYDVVAWPSYSVEESEEEVNIEEEKSSLKSVELSLALKLSRAVQQDHLAFRFERENFTRGEKVPLRCSVCHMGGHSKNSCIEFDLPQLCRLPDSYNPLYELALTKSLTMLKKLCEPRQNEVNDRQYILKRLQDSIRESYPEANLQLFGSSTNGFGFRESDLDVCLMFEDNSSGKDIDQIQIIKHLAQKLKFGKEHDLEVREILAITTAKVPIVKFFLPRSHIEVDISLYNMLALKNTQLLSTYTKIDPRVQILGYGFKYLAKLCQIGDASRGSLSSYAYILLVIHYLQNCSPPVLPVLQQLYKGQKKPEDIVDGWNAWFYDDLKKLPTVWKGYKKNDRSVAKLWIGLMRYYTETFNWDLNVVSIRQQEPLSRLQKMWNTQCIAIEDPFDLGHNLGGGLSRRMSTYIMKCFINGREAFGVAASTCTDYKQIADYAFCTSILTDGYPPNDRGCRCCGKIGHMVRECPKKRQIEDRKKDRRDKKENRQRKEAPQVERLPLKEEQPSSPGIIQIDLGPSAVRILKLFCGEGVDLMVNLGYRIYSSGDLPKSLLPKTVECMLPVNDYQEPIYIFSLQFAEPDVKEMKAYRKMIKENTLFMWLLQRHIANISSYEEEMKLCANQPQTITGNEPPTKGKRKKNKKGEVNAVTDKLQNRSDSSSIPAEATIKAGRVNNSESTTVPQFAQQKKNKKKAKLKDSQLSEIKMPTSIPSSQLNQPKAKAASKFGRFTKAEVNWLRGTNVPRGILYPNAVRKKKTAKTTTNFSKSKMPAKTTTNFSKSKMPAKTTTNIRKSKMLKNGKIKKSLDCPIALRNMVKMPEVDASTQGEGPLEYFSAFKVLRNRKLRCEGDSFLEAFSDDSCTEDSADDEELTIDQKLDQILHEIYRPQ